MSIETLIQIKRDDILRVAENHGARNVRVFGSVARGDADDHSDLDLLIDVGPRTTPWFPGGLVADLMALLGRNVDVVTERGLRPDIRARVLSEAKPLCGTLRF